MATAAEILTRIGEAETALHNLATGARVVDVWRDGRRVTYSQANIDDLREYLNWLRGEYESAVLAEAGRPRRRAIALGYRN